MELFHLLHLYIMMLLRSRHNKYKECSDLELILLYKDELNEFTIPLLYERYAHLVFGACLKYLKNREDAEDVTMKLFGELDSKIMKHPIQHFKSWLYQVTKNECLMFLRKNKTHIQTLPDQLLAIEEEHGFMDLDYQLAKLEKAIPNLKDEQRQCIELFYLQDKSYQDISDTLHIPLKRVKSAIQNGKRNLKIWMESHEA